MAEQAGATADPTDEISKRWADCAEKIWKHEKDIADEQKEEIGNLLLFAGLFSAVLTTFVFPYYQSLQSPPPSDATAQILLLLSVQLDIIAAHTGVQDVVSPVLTTISNSSSTPPTHTSAFVINGLWFSALVFSLGAASISISVAQWLNHYSARPTGSSQQSIRVWNIRHKALLKYRIPQIISVLPVLLQIALTLFLVGLVILIWPFSHVVAAVVLALVVLLLLISIGTALIPAFLSACPFKSAEAWCFYEAWRLFKLIFRSAAGIANSVYIIFLSIHVI
ncbi:uncharacterized protein FIBRA_00833 [Fibroporia radiculosa]|uniref:DUF6535 domain-containing protein n=1 Tax=Fibroporia radiculosa TaxID=599839 RepID=J4G0M6_9APHY|nr:uncharacterized protein FIBRA_00833 [Fibroporia radiculosa]CCL98828.1 predicted protein [Fibroporia radiculosa]